MIHTKIDLKQLILELRELRPRTQLYRVIKAELSKLGHWKDKPRGNPGKGFQVSRKGK